MCESYIEPFACVFRIILAFPSMIPIHIVTAIQSNMKLKIFSTFTLLLTTTTSYANNLHPRYNDQGSSTLTITAFTGPNCDSTSVNLGNVEYGVNTPVAMASFKVNRKLGDNEQLDFSRPVKRKGRKRSEDLCSVWDMTVKNSGVEAGTCYKTDDAISCLR